MTVAVTPTERTLIAVREYETAASGTMASCRRPLTVKRVVVEGGTNTLMGQNIAQFTVTVRDYDEALAFYTGKLGFERLEDSDLGNGKRWVRVRPAGSGGAAILLARAVREDQLATV